VGGFSTVHIVLIIKKGQGPMNRIEKILVLTAIGFGLLACNLGGVSPMTNESTQSLPASEIPPPSVVQPSQPQASEAEPVDGPVEPCSLITAAEAEAILAEPVSAPVAMNGACIYSNASDALYTISVAAAQDQQTNGILQGQAMLLAFGGSQLDEARMNKLKALADSMDYKGFFTELVAATEGSATLKAQLVENGGSELVYWAWITAQNRRQGAFVALRGQTLVNINLVVADTQSEESMLAASTSLADKVFGRLPAKFTLAMPAATPAQQPQVTPTNTAPPEKTIVGSWERRSSETTEYFDIQADGSYTIEARNNSTNKVVAGTNGTLTFDKSNIYYVDKDNHKTTESYYLENEGDSLVINNNAEKAWTRSK
jgi:hypothetical protein